MKCPVPGCTVDAPPRGVTCPIHWLLVPKAIRLRTRENFDPAAAPEDQSPAYLVAAAEAARAASRAEERLQTVPKITVVSIPRPWAWAVAAGVRPLENRSFAPPAQLVGQRVAIFAAPEIDREGAAAARQEFGLEYPPAAWEGGIVALAILDRVIERGSIGDPLRDSPWFSGRCGWVFREVVSFPPWPTRAEPLADLFTLPESAAARVWYRRLVSIARADLSDPLPREVPPIGS